MSVNIDIILGIILVALVAETMVNALKRLVIRDIEFPYQVVMSLIFAVGLCVLAKLDIMEGFNYTLSVPYVGEVCSGIIASLGANAVYDLTKQFREYKEMIAVEKASNFDEYEFMDGKEK